MAPQPTKVVMLRVIPEANLDLVLQEQLDYLLQSRENGTDTELNRLNRVSVILLELFCERPMRTKTKATRVG
jgi:hypothetical protein